MGAFWHAFYGERVRGSVNSENFEPFFDDYAADLDRSDEIAFFDANNTEQSDVSAKILVAKKREERKRRKGRFWRRFAGIVAGVASIAAAPFTGGASVAGLVGAAALLAVDATSAAMEVRLDKQESNARVEQTRLALLKEELDREKEMKMLEVDFGQAYNDGMARIQQMMVQSTTLEIDAEIALQQVQTVAADIAALRQHVDSLAAEHAYWQGCLVSRWRTAHGSCAFPPQLSHRTTVISSLMRLTTL